PPVDGGASRDRRRVAGGRPGAHPGDRLAQPGGGGEARRARGGAARGGDPGGEAGGGGRGRRAAGAVVPREGGGLEGGRMIPILLRDLRGRLALLLFVTLAIYFLEPAFHRHEAAGLPAELGPVGISA